MYNLEGKTAIVTGSGRPKGIGEAIIYKLASEGCNVVITDIGVSKAQFDSEHIGTTDDMETIATKAKSFGVQAIAVVCDVRYEDQVTKLIKTAKETFGSVDILVNNAGIGYIMEPFTEFKEENWNAVLDVNLKGAFLCSKHAAIAMKAQGTGGAIINIASQAAKSGLSLIHI